MLFFFSEIPLQESVVFLFSKRTVRPAISDFWKNAQYK